MSKRTSNDVDEDGEDDYMSDKFINQMEQNPRPSLLFNHRMKREHESFKKKKAFQFKPVKVLEKEKREEGLNKPLDESNRGFQLLAKMGFKKDDIGAEEKAPISLKLKESRTGLGIKSNEELEKERVKMREVIQKTSEREFLEVNRIRNQMRLMKVDFKKSQSACQKFDSQSGKMPVKEWFWLEEIQEKSDEQDDEKKELEDDEEESIEERLELLTDYLRKNYFYCIWCAIAFNDEDDLKTNCPGASRNHHDE